MLSFNLLRILHSRHVIHPTNYLMQTLGFCSNTATELKQGRTRKINLDHLEKLCLNLNCTPNDLLQYTPPKNNPNPNHPLNSLIRSQREELSELMQTLPAEELESIKQFIQQRKN